MHAIPNCDLPVLCCPFDNLMQRSVITSLTNSQVSMQHDLQPITYVPCCAYVPRTLTLPYNVLFLANGADACDIREPVFHLSRSTMLVLAGQQASLPSLRCCVYFQVLDTCL